MCTICGSSNCSRNTRTTFVKVYGGYIPYTSQKKYLGTTTINDYDDERTIRRKVATDYPDWDSYKRN